jgi:hypothetical protein
MGQAGTAAHAPQFQYELVDNIPGPVDDAHATPQFIPIGPDDTGLLHLGFTKSLRPDIGGLLKTGCGGTGGYDGGLFRRDAEVFFDTSASPFTAPKAWG